MMSRSRNLSNPSDILDVLRPFAQQRSWLRYDESAKPSDAKVDQELIKQPHVILSKLYEVAPNLTFTRSALISAIDMMFDEKAEEWKMIPEHKQDYVETMTRRLLNICRVVSQACVQAEKKGQAPAWVKELPWWKKKKYLYKCNAELKIVERTTSPSARPEPSLPISRLEGAVDTDTPVAEWPDGHKYLVAGVTFASLSKKPEAAVEVHFESEHKDTHHRVTVKDRTDRQPLISMYEQQRQVLQVSVNSFGSHRQAAAFMVGIAKQYCNGEVDKAMLKELRDRTIPKKAGVSRRSSTAKRPACNMENATQHSKETDVTDQWAYPSQEAGLQTPDTASTASPKCPKVVKAIDPRELRGIGYDMDII